MQYRRFGKTELMLPVFTLGGMRIPGSGVDNVSAVLTRALEVGINHIETARGYGDSEDLFGQALQQLGVPRDRLVVTTKISPRGTADEFRGQLDICLEKLGVGYLDTLAIHGINDDETLARATDEKGNWAGVRRAMDDGLIRHIGFSSHGDTDIHLDAINTEMFDFMNLHYYYFMQWHRPAVLRARELDMGIFIISPVDKGGFLHTPTDKLVELCKPLSPIQFTCRWLLAQPEIHTLSLGAAKPDEFDEQLAVADNVGPLSDEEQAIDDRLMRAVADLGEPPELACIREHTTYVCPDGVPITGVLRLRTLAKAFDMHDYGRDRYSMFGVCGHWAPGMRADRCAGRGDTARKVIADRTLADVLFGAHDLLTAPPGKRLWA